MVKKRRVKRKNFFFSTMLICLVLYMLKNANNSLDMVLVKQSTLENTITLKGLIIKDEYVCTSDVDGNVLFNYEEGKRISQGLNIATVNIDTNTSEIRRQIAEVENEINLRKNNIAKTKKTNFDQPVSRLNVVISQVDDMYKPMNAGEKSIKSKYESYSTEDLENLKNSLTKSLTTNQINYYSEKAGILSYSIDGLEEICNYENAMEITPGMFEKYIDKNFDLPDVGNNSFVEKNQALYKVINNFKYYVAISVSNENISMFEKEKNNTDKENEENYKLVKLKMICDDFSNEIFSYVHKINYGDNESVVILYFDDYLHDLYNKRYVNLELVTSEIKGIGIPVDAITYEDDIAGVYVQEASKLIRFYPIEIIEKNKDMAIVSVGIDIGESSRNVIEIQGVGRRYTIQDFDMVIYQPEKVKKRQIIN